jgi:hypothetical protein
MSQYGSRTSTKQQELRISTLEKRQAQRQADAENAAPIKSPIRLEGPGDVLTLFEEAVSLVRNATKSQDVAKGRALAYIAAKGVGILPLVEAAKAQAKDWEKIHRVQRAMSELVSRDPRVRQVISDGIVLEVEANKLAESYAREGEKEVAESDDTCEGDEEGWIVSYEGKDDRLAI